MSDEFSNMGLTSSKPFQISLSDITEKVRCYSACCGSQIIVEDHCQFEESEGKERQKHNGEDFSRVDRYVHFSGPIFVCEID